MSLKAISISTGICGLLTLSGLKFPDLLPEKLCTVLEKVAGNLNEDESIDFLAACGHNSGSNFPKTEAKKVYGAAQEHLKQLLADKDKNNTFCGLRCVEYKGFSCWTLEVNRAKIEKDALHEIETDALRHCKVKSCSLIYILTS